MSVPQVVFILIFHQYHDLQQPGEARSGPYLTAAPQPLLELLAQRFNGTASTWSTCFFHRLVVQMITMFFKKLHLSFNQFLSLGRSFRLVLEQLLKLPHHIIFPERGQTMKGVKP